MHSNSRNDGNESSSGSARTIILQKTLKLLITMVTVMASFAITAPAHALKQGTTNIGFGLSTGRALNQTYTVIGLRLGHYFADGLEFAVNGELWRGEDPDIYKIAPEVRYVWFDLPSVKPYIGAFYARTIYDGLADRNSYGLKGGVYMRVSSNAHLGAGLVYERIESCNPAIYKDCSELYPEVSFNVSF